MVGSALLQVSEALNVCVLFPFLPFFVEHVGMGGKHLGTYCGILAASFCFGQLLSSLVWAKIADLVGRKTALIWGTLGTGMGMFVFGLSTTYAQAVFGRLLSGALCGNLLVLKTFLAEITDESNRGAGFSILSVAWSIGTVIAPLVGGLLSEPATRYPNTFSADGIFGRYPYFLPCLITCIYNVVSVFFVWGVMTESRPGSWSTSTEPVAYGKVPLNETDGAGKVVSVLHLHDVENLQSPMDEDVGAVENGLEMTQLSELSLEADEALAKPSSPAPATEKKLSMLWRPMVVAATGNYGLICFAYVVLDETLPLFLKLDVELGGFSYNSHDIGVVLSTSGFLMLIFTLTLLPGLANGSKPQMFLTGCLGSVPAAVLYPVGSAVVGFIGSSSSSAHSIGSAYLITVKFIQNVFATLAFTAIVVQINESVDENELADVNAMGQMFASAARALGPGLGGLMWALSVNEGFIYFNFLVTAATLVGAVVLNRMVVSKIPRRVGPKNTAVGASAKHTALPVEEAWAANL